MASHSRMLPPDVEAVRRANEQLRPSFAALRADAAHYNAARSGKQSMPGWLGVLRLCWSSDAFAGVALYRARIALKKRGVPILPAILNRLAIAVFNMNIDDHIVIREGLYIPHGNVVLGGFTLIGRDAEIGPWASIGTRAGSFQGPVLGDHVTVSAHCSILGTMTLGDGSTVLPGSVVAGNVAPGICVTGVPAREVERDAPDIRLVQP